MSGVRSGGGQNVITFCPPPERCASLGGVKLANANGRAVVVVGDRIVDVAEVSAVLPLLPGDVIFTGTPAGVGMARQAARFLRPGQTLESWVEGIGTIRNRCT